MRDYPHVQWAMGNCFYCQKPTYRMGPLSLHPQKYTRDHLIPRKLRGAVTGCVPITWTVTCCLNCNQKKGAKSPLKFLQKFPRANTKGKRRVIHRAFDFVKNKRIEDAANFQREMAHKLQYKDDAVFGA